MADAGFPGVLAQLFALLTHDPGEGAAQARQSA